MQVIESTFLGGDGIVLFRRSWLPEGAVKGAIALVHGYAEHSGRYAWFGQQLTAAGYALHAYDLRGHGQSPGPRTLVRSMNEHLDDLGHFLATVRAESSGLRVYLMGHSMGGGIATLYTVSRGPELPGLILSGPAVGRIRYPARLMVNLIGLFGRIRPGAGVRVLPADGVSRDPEVVTAYVADPLVYRGKMPAGLIGAMARAGDRIDRDSERITCPLLILQGADDALCSPDASRLLFGRAQTADKEIHVYEGLAHEVLNEPEKDAVVGDLLAWLAKRAA